MKWFKEAIKAARDVRRMRKSGFDGELAVLCLEDVSRLHSALRNITASHKLAYDCIEDMAQGKSRCKYCMAYAECEDKRRQNVRGCPEWILKFPEEMIASEQAAATEGREAEQEDQAAPGGDDEGAADCGADQKRDHAG